MTTHHQGGPPTLDVSVVIPTIGRPAELRTTLEALAVCRPRAAEIVVVDQSGGEAVTATVADFADAGVTCIRSAGRGIGLAVNEGLDTARHEIVLATHDDCSVDADWIAVGHRLATASPSCIFTGRVLPEGDPAAVPSTREDPNPQDHTGEIGCHLLYPANMVLPRRRILDFGAFDDRFRTAAEDNDLCYRWLKAGGCLRYEPTLTVWHRDWRTKDELRDLYVRYWREQGRFYAKHLRSRDLTILGFLWTDTRYLLGLLRGVLSSAIRRRRLWYPDQLRGLLRGLVPGLVEGWRDFRGRAKSGRQAT